MKRILLLLTLLLATCLSHAVEIEVHTKGMQKIEGYFTLYYQKQSDQIFVQVPKDSTAFIFQSSLPRGVGSNDIGLDRGQLGKTRLVSFSVEGNKVLLTQKNTQYRAITEDAAEAKSVKEAFAESILYGFEIVAQNEKAVLIDYTPFLKSDIHQISDRLRWQKEGQYQIDTSRSVLWPERIKSFPKNTELEAKVTFTGKDAGQYVRSVVPEPNAITVHLHHSFIALPEPGYQPRVFHPLSGYLVRGYEDYAAPLQGQMKQQFIPRHRLIKKDPTAEVSEAVEPIIYYLDPGVPEPVRSALLDGAKWWAEAFEAAGFKDAYQVKILPEDADPMDVRYNVIQWVHRATRGWSYGASVVDPRTGEILKGHVTLGSLRVRQDMLIAQGLLAPYQNKTTDAKYQKEIEAMALARIRQLSAHEVGHTLGIAHNFAASPQNRASVMDYPSPYITTEALKQGDLSHAYGVGIGEWDKFAIAYGYQAFPEGQEAQGLKQILQTLESKKLNFIADADARPFGGGHATAHLWDNGESVNQEMARLVKLRNQAIKNFGLDNLATQRPVSELGRIFVPVYLMHRYQTEAVAKQIAGATYSYSVKNVDTRAEDVAFKPVPYAVQKDALLALLETLDDEFLSVPKPLARIFLPKAMGDYKTREDFETRLGLFPDPIGMAEASAHHTLSLLLHAERLNRLSTQTFYDAKQLSLNEVLKALTHFSLHQLNRKEDAIVQRVTYLIGYHLYERLNDANTTPEVKAAVLNSLQQWQQDLTKQSKRRASANAEFMRYMAWMIDESIKKGGWAESFQPLGLPPGAPI